MSGNEVISYDVDYLRAFISRLTELIEGFDTPAKDVAAVRTALNDAASIGTNGSGVAPVFEPLGIAADVAVRRTEFNLEILVEHLVNDRNRLQRTLDAALAAESESAHHIHQVGQTLSRHDVFS